MSLGRFTTNDPDINLLTYSNHIHYTRKSKKVNQIRRTDR
jgi:hypothetical protein